MTQIVKTLIVDDEQNGAENLSILLNNFCPQVQILKIANSLTEAEGDILTLDPELVFLDIRMGDELVFDMLEKIPEINFEVIFVSAHDHALDAFKFMAIDYLLKPVDIDSLKRAVDRALYSIKNKQFSDNLKEILASLRDRDGDVDSKKIPVPTANGYEMISVREIMYCIADGNYTTLHLNGKQRYLVSKHLKFYEGLLRRYDFLRPHNSFLVNRSYIKKVSTAGNGYLEMDDGKTLSISKSRRKETLTRLMLK